MLGIDFGTTNSSVARADKRGAVQLVQFPAADALVAAYRSLLYLEHTKTKTRSQLHSWSGPEGIERYLAAEPKGRLIQSLKSYLSSRTLTGTEVFGRRQLLEDLIARILGDLRKHAESYFGCPVHVASVGRPVHFVGAESGADDVFALERLGDAFSRGYQLHQAVQRTKIALSHQDQAHFVFRDHGFNLRASVTRAEFESWIILALISGVLDRSASARASAGDRSPSAGSPC